MPVLLPREPVVVAVVRDAAVVGRAGDDEVDTRVRERQRAGVTMPHLHDAVVVEESVPTIGAQALPFP